MIEQINELIKKIDALSIVEGKGHLPHPEDFIFDEPNPESGANKAINAILATAKNPKQITIKWDGYPALIFGRGSNGKFSIMDKHMFNRKDGLGRQVYSPDEFRKYDLARNVDRTGLHELINNIWPGLEKETQEAPGYYWGDLLFSQPLKPIDGLYRFKANPNGIMYTVEPDSEVGKLLTNKAAGISVHQYLSPDAASTDDAQSLHGSIGSLKNNSNVAIVPSAMPIAPRIKVNQSLVSEVKRAVSKYGAAATKLMTTAPQAKNTFNQLFTTYINKKIVSGNLNNLVNDFINYFETRPMTDTMKKKLADHLNANKDGLVGVFAIWLAVYNLKMDIVPQLNKAAEDSPIQGYLQDGTATQEGFVSQGVKFIDRMGFSRQNLANR